MDKIEKVRNHLKLQWQMVNFKPLLYTEKSAATINNNKR